MHFYCYKKGMYHRHIKISLIELPGACHSHIRETKGVLYGMQIQKESLDVDLSRLDVEWQRRFHDCEQQYNNLKEEHAYFITKEQEYFGDSATVGSWKKVFIGKCYEVEDQNKKLNRELKAIKRESVLEEQPILTRYSCFLWERIPISSHKHLNYSEHHENKREKIQIFPLGYNKIIKESFRKDHVFVKLRKNKKNR